MDDRELVWRWVRAWAHVRGLVVEQRDGWPLVHVRAASRESEIVCVDPRPGVLEVLAARVAGRERAMLTVMSASSARLTTLATPPGLRVDRVDEVFMTTALSPAPTRAPDGYTSRWVVDGPRASYRLDADGCLAAEGTVGVLGVDAVYDAVETSATHRRRGLGRHVMGALGAWAVSEGASTGLLAASAQGRDLYRSIGWDTTLLMRSFMGTVP